MTLQQAQQLTTGTTVYHATKKNADGKTPMRAKVTSIKTWKRQPEKIEIHVKRGLRDFAVFTESELDQLTTSF